MLILAYHTINSRRRDDLAVSINNFERQLNYLSKKGYHTVSLAQIIKSLKEKRTLLGRPLVITFDDGYRDNYTNAYPILKRYGFSALIFLTTEYIGSDKLFQSPEHIKRYGGKEEDYRFLNWEEIKEMRDNGIEFGSHTISHPHLTRLSYQEARKEIQGSKKQIEEKIGTKIIFFCYPYGDFNNEIVDLVKKSGYLGACITYGPPQNDLGEYGLNRVGIYRKNGMLTFRFKLRGGQNWLHTQLRRLRVKRLGMHW